MGELSDVLSPYYPSLRALLPIDRSELPSALPRSGCGDDGGSSWTTPARTVWVQCKTLDHFRRAAPALDLIMLLGRCDIQVWREVISEIWANTAATCQWMEMAEKESKVSLGIQIVVDRCSELSALSEIMTGTRVFSAKYHRARAEIQEVVDRKRRQNKRKGVCDDDNNDQSRPSISVALQVDSDRRRKLTQIVPLVMMEPSTRHVSGTMHPAVGGESVCQFRIDEVDITSTDPLPIEALYCIIKMHRCGVRMRSLPPLEMESVDSATAVVVDALRSMLAVGSTSCSAAASPSQPVTKLTIVIRFLGHLQGALFSAVEESQSLQAVDISFGDEPSRFGHIDWQWVAYALFSSHANHTVDELTINVRPLRAKTVVAMEAILTADDPLAVLYGNRSQGKVQPAYVWASQFYLSDPVGLNYLPANAIYDTGKRIRVRVIDWGGVHTSGWTHVYLPGQGKAWIPCHTGRPDTSTDITTPSRHAIPSISFSGVTSESSEAVIGFLQLVGQQVKSITVLQAGRIPNGNEWCRQVMQSCPQLQAFNAQAIPIHKLQVFTDSFAAGGCGLSKLAITYVGVSTNQLDWRSFFAALSEPHHSMAMHLQELEMRIPLVAQESMDSFVDGAVEMLNRNRRLYSFKFVIQVAPHRATTTREVLQATLDEKYKLKPRGVMIRVAPLEIAKKLAFLSVISSRLATDSTSANVTTTTTATTAATTASTTALVSPLNSHVTSLIFQFAAQGRLRSVDVQIELSDSLTY